jgi:hypothetical protein
MHSRSERNADELLPTASGCQMHSDHAEPRTAELRTAGSEAEDVKKAASRLG